MCTFCLHYIKLIIEKYGWKYIPLATTNVYITKYVVWLKAIAFKECPAPTCSSEHHDSMKYHTLEQKKKYSLEKTLMLGKIEGRRKRGRQRMGWLDGITDLMDMNLSKLWDWWWARKSGVLQFMGLQRVGHDWATELRAKNKIAESKGINITFQSENSLTFWLLYHGLGKIP